MGSGPWASLSVPGALMPLLELWFVDDRDVHLVGQPVRLHRRVPRPRDRFTPTRIGAGAALGCATIFASQAIGGRDSRHSETLIGCLGGGAGSLYSGNSAVLGVAFGVIVSTAQSIATWAFGK